MHGFKHVLALGFVVLSVALAFHIAPKGATAIPLTPEAAAEEIDALPAQAWGLAEIDAAFRRALLGYAIARGLNGVISVAQGTEVAVQPAGVGLNFTPGEILDPINDLVERFSWIMMLASSSLGIQHVLLSMSGWWGLAVAIGVAGGLWAGIGLWRDRRKPSAMSQPVVNAAHVAGRVFLFLLVLRFMMPAIALVNERVYATFLADDYISASAELREATEAIGEINENLTEAEPSDDDAGLVDRAKNLLDRAIARVSIDQRIEEYRVAAESISENTIRLIVVFLMQTVVFPLVFLFVAWGLLRRLARF